MDRGNGENRGYKIVNKFILRSDRVLNQQVVPLHDIEAVAGLKELYIDDYVPVEEIKISDMPPCDGAVHVQGDSMYPLLHHGDIVFFKTTQSRRGGLLFGHIYLLVFSINGDNYVTIKYVYESDNPGFYRLESHNPEYQSKEIPRNSVRLMGLVKGSYRSY